ncbi:hypothetical protein ROS1_20330 [Roseibium sp. ROS1]|jgi:hypothetical protein|nr:hypothetical protein FIU93_25135 [Labrenzia sp. THAF35]
MLSGAYCSVSGGKTKTRMATEGPIRAGRAGKRDGLQRRERTILNVQQWMELFGGVL